MSANERVATDPGARRAAVPSHPSASDLARKGAPIELSLRTASRRAGKADVLAVGVFADGSLPPGAQAMDRAGDGRIAGFLKRGDLPAKPGGTLLVYDPSGTPAQRLLLVSLGPADRFDEQAFRKAVAGAAKVLAASRAQEVAIALTDIEVPGRSTAWRVQQAGRLLADGYYEFAAPRAATNGAALKRDQPARIALLLSEQATPALDLAVRSATAIAEGMALAKDLGNLPGNICHPGYLADTARALGKELGLGVEVLEREDMAKLGMYSALSVGQASAQPCRLIVMKYMGAQAREKPIVLIGKGVTFDTGGVSLKPGEDLDMMKYDMCGAASVFGAMKTAARLALPVNLIGLVGAVENMPGGNASRPGDVVTSMSGQTIEILNTDAEGRLVLCDVMTYAERFEPACVIDVATLTGACVIALGSQTSGLFTHDDALADELLQCGAATGDRAWRMPLFDEYQEQLKSNFADMSNLGGRAAGAVTAACFLARFAKAYTWAHLDIAGTASVGGDSKGATGRPVPLLSQFLLKRAEQAAAQPNAPPPS